MTVRCIAVAGIAPQAWRNGGGRTRELLTWPAAGDWLLRISLADIDADGPFSVFPGTVRWLAVVEGAGVTLSFGQSGHRLGKGAAPLRFDAEEAPHCRLIDGSTRDLNLMLRGGDGTMRAVEPAVPWRDSFAMRGLYAATPGRWSAAEESLEVGAGTLLWSDEAGALCAPWRFAGRAPGAAVSGWWLGFTPASSHR